MPCQQQFILLRNNWQWDLLLQRNTKRLSVPLSLSSSFYTFLSVHFSLSFSVSFRLPKFNVMLLIKTPEESPSEQLFDWARQKVKAVRTKKAAACLLKKERFDVFLFSIIQWVLRDVMDSKQRFITPPQNISSSTNEVHIIKEHSLHTCVMCWV